MCEGDNINIRRCSASYRLTVFDKTSVDELKTICDVHL